MEKNLQELLNEEKELQFTSFNEDTAWEIGSSLVEIAKKENLPITIDVTFAGHQLFHASRPGTSVDNDEWIKRKNRQVYRCGHSSFYMGQLLKSEGRSIEEKLLIPESDFGAHGGSFPVIIKRSGVVGTIAVSGLKQEEDHQLVVRAIRSYLNR